jgi:hypothetical protein
MLSYKLYPLNRYVIKSMYICIYIYSYGVMGRCVCLCARLLEQKHKLAGDVELLCTHIYSNIFISIFCY